MVDEYDEVTGFIPDKSFMDIINPDYTETQLFTEYGGIDIKIQGKKGTKISIPANALVDENGNDYKGNVELRLKEFYSMTDFAFSGLQTMSGDEILESGGMFHIEVTGEGIPLSLKPGSEAQIEMPADTAFNDMQVFYGNNANGNVDWMIKEENMAKISVKEEIPDFYHRQISKDLNEGWQLNVKGILSGETNIMKKKYSFAIDGFGWINCDRFKKSGNRSNVLVCLPDMGNYSVFAAFVESKSLLKADYIDKQNVYRFPQMPVNDEIIIFAVKIEGDKTFGCTCPFIVGSSPVQNLTPEEITLGQLEAELAKLQ